MFLRKSPTRRIYAAASITRREVMFTTLAFILFTISKHDCLHGFLLSICNLSYFTPVKILVELVVLETTTYCLQSSRSNQLNYNPVLVGSAGVEPEQTAPKTVVLTITPQANTKMPKNIFSESNGIEPYPLSTNELISSETLSPSSLTLRFHVLRR